MKLGSRAPIRIWRSAASGPKSAAGADVDTGSDPQLGDFISRPLPAAAAAPAKPGVGDSVGGTCHGVTFLVRAAMRSLTSGAPARPADVE